MYKVQYVSIRDNEVAGTLAEEFTTLAEVQRFVPPDLRGIASFWQVRVIDSDDPDTVVMYGYRAGPNGTGERWTWDVHPSRVSAAGEHYVTGIDRKEGK